MKILINFKFITKFNSNIYCVFVVVYHFEYGSRLGYFINGFIMYLYIVALSMILAI